MKWTRGKGRLSFGFRQVYLNEDGIERWEWSV